MGIILSLTLLIVAGAFVGAIAMALRENGGAVERFALSRVLSDALAAITAAPMIFIGTVALTTALPVLAVVLGAIGGTMGGDAIFAFVLLGGVAMALIGQLGQMAMVVATLEAVAGRQPRIAAVLRSVLPLVPQGLLLAILWWVAVLIGFTFFVVPGVMLICLWFVPTAALVAERRGVFASFSRSAELTKGARWRIFLLLCIGAVFWMVMQSILGVLAAALGDGIAATVAYALATALMGMLPPAVSASAFHLLRTGKEGLGTQELEQVFA
ncbi:YciC family protein [Sphingomonas sp.]